MSSAFEKAFDKLFDKRMESVALYFIKVDKMTLDEIAQGTNLTLDRIEQLAASVKAAEN